MVKSARLFSNKAMIAFSLVIIAALVLPVVGCAPKAPEEAAPVVNIRIHSQMPVGHYITETVDLFIKEAEARSKGSLKFTHYPAAQLYKDMDMINVLPKGGVEMAQISTSMFFGKVPEVSGAAVVGLYDSFEQAIRLCYDIDHGGGYTPKVLEPAFEKINIKLLSFLCYSICTVTATTKPVRKVEDYRGLRIRSLAKSVSVLLEAVGAAPVIMSAADMYMGLQRGVIDGVFTGATSIYERKLFEVVKHMQDLSLWIPSGFSLAANLDFWNSLAPSQKKAILEAALIAEIYSTERAIQGETDARKSLISQGLEIYDFPAGELQKFNGLVRPAITEMLRKDLGEEIGNTVQTMLETTREGKTTWKKCCELNNKRMLAEIK